MMLFSSQKPEYEVLRKKWLNKSRVNTQSVFDKHLKTAALSSLGGLMMLSQPGLAINASSNLVDDVQIHKSKDTNGVLANILKNQVPTDTRALDSREEAQIGGTLSQAFNLKVAAELDGKKLNRSYGLIGGEQHLYRYPGDNVFAHAATAQDWAMYGDAGIAPGLGAWGYFAPSREAMTQQDEMREKYYIAVQTFLAPGFAERTAEYRDFFKYRKMLVVNPTTGQAVVADVADAGPSEYTGKHLGGSPEVMQELGLGSGPRKGAVLYFFIDDPKDQVPLGPIKTKEDLSLTKQS